VLQSVHLAMQDGAAALHAAIVAAADDLAAMYDHRSDGNAALGNAGFGFGDGGGEIWVHDVLQFTASELRLQSRLLAKLVGGNPVKNAMPFDRDRRFSIRVN